MGKKVKKDEKPAAEDVFDPLQVESHNATTAALMLDSPEEEVLAKACEAIYKHADKCDDNKKGLLELGVIDSLLRLISNEDRLVRRNACSAIGIMAANADVRKALRKREEATPSIIQLLSPEEDTVVNEFAAMCLSFMAQEFSSKVNIYENGGLEPLARCLISTDPDVQKNAVETIAQMLLDYQVRAGLKETDVIKNLLELMKSEYAIIQQMALLALERAAQDADNRGVLRELDSISRLIDFIGHPEFSDLHVQTILVLSNLLEDTESLEQIKESGGLKRLVALITDQSPPEEEKGGKGEKKSGSRTGKKSAKDKKKEEEKDEPSYADGIIPTLPDVKVCAAKAIARSAKHEENRKILHEQEVEKMMIQLLGHENVDVQACAAQALGVMSELLLSRDSIREWEGIPPLLKLLHSDNDGLKQAASLALANLSTDNTNNCSELLNLNGFDILISLLSSDQAETASNCAVILTNIAQEESLRSEAQSKNVITSLIGPLKASSTLLQSKAALALSMYLCDVDSRSEFRNGGGIVPLLDLLNSNTDTVRRNAAWALTVCARDEQSANEISRLGGLEVLQTIQLSGQKQNIFAKAAMNKVLDSNLSAKYAIIGQLDSSNMITDGFFDAGQMRPGAKFLSLEDYYRQPLNDKRPILLINAKAELASESNACIESDVKQDSSKTSVSGKSSRTGRDSKGKSRAQRDQEKQREDELQAQLQKELEDAAGDKVVVLPGDPTLMRYLEEVAEKILSMPTTRSQVTALAQYVAEKMGGPIEQGQLVNFSWELPLSQIKYELKNNVIPIGRIKAGIHLHRALLFKTLADRIAVSSTLTRGEYNRAWNTVLLTNTHDNPGNPKYPPQKYVVDLIHRPGDLLLIDTPEALAYQRL